MIVPRGLADLAKCAATESTRYAIDRVQLSRVDGNGVAQACATDGRRLLVAQWEAGDDEAGDAALVPARDFAAALKLGSKTRPVRFDEIASKADQLHFLATGDRALTIDLDAPENPPKFPSAESLQNVTPRCQKRLRLPAPMLQRWAMSGQADHVAIAVNAKYLAEMLTAAHKALNTGNEDDPAAVVLRIPLDPARPMLIEGKAPSMAGMRVAGVLMPVNVDVDQRAF